MSVTNLDQLNVETAGGLQIAGTAVSSTATELNILDGVTATAAELNKSASIDANAYQVVAEEVTFTEAGGTTYTGTVAIPAGSTVLNIEVRSTVLWDDGTSASMNVGDDDDADGYFTAINVKATDLLVGEVISFTQTGGKEGAYIVTASGLRSASYYATANNVIGVVTTGAQDGTAGRTRMLVVYVTPTATAATGA